MAEDPPGDAKHYGKIYRVHWQRLRFPYENGTKVKEKVNTIGWVCGGRQVAGEFDTLRYRL